MKGIVRRKALQSASRSERNFAAEGEQGEICEGVLWGCEVHRSRHPFLHRPMCAFDPLSRFLMLPASKVHVGAGRDHAVEHLLELADQRYVLGAIVLPQPNHAVEQHEVLRHFALSAVIVVAAAVAHASRRAAAECCLSVCLVRSYSSAAARRSPSLATRNSLRSGETRRSAILRRAPRSSTCTAVFDVHRARAPRVPWPLTPLPMQTGFSFSNFGY